MQEMLRVAGSILGLGRYPGEENGNPVQYSCLGSPMDRGAWQATVHGLQSIGHYLAMKQQQKHVFQGRKDARDKE